MKKNKIIFWTTSIIIAAMMLFNTLNFFTNEEARAGMDHLGFPAYFGLELIMAKTLGAIAMLLPVSFVRLKSFTYVGFSIVYISAFIAHLAVGDPVSNAIAPLVFLAILAVSYLCFNKLRSMVAVDAQPA